MDISRDSRSLGFSKETLRQQLIEELERIEAQLARIESRNSAQTQALSFTYKEMIRTRQALLNQLN